jgi:hypothetical protein
MTLRIRLHTSEATKAVRYFASLRDELGRQQPVATDDLVRHCQLTIVALNSLAMPGGTLIWGELFATENAHA